MSIQKNLHIHVSDSFIHNCQNWKQSRCSSKGEQTVVYPYRGISFTDKKRNKSSSYKTQRKYKRILLSKRRQLKMATYLYDSNYINIQEKTKLQRQCKDQWSPGACGEEE